MVYTMKNSLLNPAEWLHEGLIGREMDFGPNSDGTAFALYIDKYECGIISNQVMGWLRSFGSATLDATFVLKSVTTNAKTGKQTWYYTVTVNA